MQDIRLTTILNRYGKAHQRIKLVEEIGEMLAEVPMLQMAIEQKIDRQIGRILRSEGADGNRR